MNAITEPKPELQSSMTDTRGIRLDDLKGMSQESLRRLVDPADAPARIPVAAFQASL